jgi:ornithine carbamoyltransferase
MASTELRNLDLAAKDYLSVLDLSSSDLERLLDVARQVKADRCLRTQAPTASALAGCHVAMLFEKPSLRTRSTFEIAVKELGAETLHVPSEFAAGTANRYPTSRATSSDGWTHSSYAPTPRTKLR